MKLAAFAVASVVLAATPGPGMLYIATRTLSQGRASGFASVAGVAAGNLANAIAAALGLAALLALWPAAHQALRAVGGAYLLWLAVTAWRHSAAAADGGGVRPPPVSASAWHTVREGFWVALMNPKTALFFAAFLPPFLDPDGAAPAAQSVLLGALFVAIAATSDSLVVLTAGALSPRRRGPRAGGVGGRLSAAVYATLGLYAWFG